MPLENGVIAGVEVPEAGAGMPSGIIE